MGVENYHPKTTDPIVLFQDNIKLAEFFAHKFFPKVSRGSFLYEELVGEARVALWKAAKTYDPTKNVKFSTYTGICIYKLLLKYYKRVHKKQEVAFGYSLEFSPDENNYCVGDLLTSDADTENDALINITQMSAKKVVYEKYKILELYFFEGLTQEAIAKKLGMSQMAISRHIKKDLNRLKNELKLA